MQNWDSFLTTTVSTEIELQQGFFIFWKSSVSLPMLHIIIPFPCKTLFGFCFRVLGTLVCNNLSIASKWLFYSIAGSFLDLWLWDAAVAFVCPYSSLFVLYLFLTLVFCFRAFFKHASFFIPIFAAMLQQ